MTMPAQHQGADMWTAGGSWRFSRETVVLGAPADTLYGLYHQAFEPLKVQAAARQVLTQEEFLAQMVDQRIDKYVAWEAEEPVGLITLTRHLDAVPWISTEYYAARYPEQSARNVVYYLGYLLARPSSRQARFLETITKVCIEPLVAERAVIAFDVCSYNNDVLGFSERISGVVRQWSSSDIQRLDTQVYHAVNFA